MEDATKNIYTQQRSDIMRWLIREDIIKAVKVDVC